jgi:hypothetical protein
MQHLRLSGAPGTPGQTSTGKEREKALYPQRVILTS